MSDLVLCSDIITDALADLNAEASGESIAPEDSTLALRRLNLLIQKFNNDHQVIFAQQEVIHTIVANQSKYSIGPGGSIGAVLAGSVTGNILTVTNATAGCVFVGLRFPVTFNGAVVDCVICALNTGVGGAGANAAGTYFLNKNIPGTVAGPFTGFADRPIRINNAFARTSSSGGPLDFPVEIIAQQQYMNIGMKLLAGPWPRVMYYQPTEPVGMLNYWLNPSGSEMHLLVDMQITAFASLQDAYYLQPGMQLLLQHGLSLLMAPAFGKLNQARIGLIKDFYADDLDWLKGVNSVPQSPMSIDSALVPDRIGGALWIYTGGYY